jgi:hypothetical protein
MQRIRIFRLLFQQAAIHRLRLLEPPCLVMCQTHLQQRIGKHGTEIRICEVTRIIPACGDNTNPLTKVVWSHHGRARLLKPVFDMLRAVLRSKIETGF